MHHPLPPAPPPASPEAWAGGSRGLGYHQVHRAGRPGWWRPLVGVVFVGASWFFAGLVLLLAVGTVRAVWRAGQGQSPFSGTEDALASTTTLTPWSLAYIALSLAVLIPLTFVAQRMLHGLRPSTLTSVVPRMRWSFFFACVGLAVVALLATMVVSALVPAGTTGDVGGELASFSKETQWFLVIILMVIPFQAAGEEYAFRGYLTQVFGGWFGTWGAVLVPALLFALAHGAQDPPIFVDRFAFGVVAGILVVRTGGLEAAIAMHVLNNWLAFGLALLLGEMDSVLTPTSGTWWSLPVTLTQSITYLALALWVSRVMGLPHTTQGGVLAGQPARV